MQRLTVDRGREPPSVAGLGQLTLLEHRVRLQYDLIYELLALHQDQSGLTSCEGALTSFWLLPGHGKTVQMTDKKLLLHVVVPDWTQWVEHYWEQKPEARQFFLIRQHVPSASRERSIYNVIGTSQADRSSGLQTVLIDLTFSNIRRRGAIRYHIMATVAELVVLFVGGPIQFIMGYWKILSSIGMMANMCMSFEQWKRWLSRMLFLSILSREASQSHRYVSKTSSILILTGS